MVKKITRKLPAICCVIMFLCGCALRESEKVEEYSAYDFLSFETLVREIVIETSEVSTEIETSDIELVQMYQGSFSQENADEILVVCKLLKIPHVGGLDRRACMVLEKETLRLIAYKEIAADEVVLNCIQTKNGQNKVLVIGSTTYQGICSQTVEVLTVENQEWKSEALPTATPQAEIPEDDIITKVHDATTLCFGNPVDNPEMGSVMAELITEENKFINFVETVWPSENAEQIEYGGNTYLLVSGTSWEEYENTAKKFYSDNYTTNVFTPQYLMNSSWFIELDGKLYRAMADGIGMSVIKDSINIWELSDGLYYVTISLDTEVPGVRSYIIKDNPDKMYGYEIVNKRHHW